MSYDPKYPWRPSYAWDSCPGCFENFDFDFKCDHCGCGHADYDPSGPKSVHRIYWTEGTTPKFEDQADLVVALKRTEEIRKQHQFVVIASQIAECTSLQGVAAPSPDYSWKKRRT